MRCVRPVVVKSTRDNNTPTAEAVDWADTHFDMWQHIRHVNHKLPGAIYLR
jgi:hypothetical protein